MVSTDAERRGGNSILLQVWKTSPCEEIGGAMQRDVYFNFAGTNQIKSLLVPFV